MSHYTRLDTRIVSVEHLIAALADMGFDHVEHHDVAEHLYGYEGDVREDRAEVIVRRAFIGELSNDIGFRRTADGNFEAIISDYDRDTYGREWLGRLTQRYAYRVARDVLRDQDFDLVEESMDQDRRIHMTVRRMA